MSEIPVVGQQHINVSSGMSPTMRAALALWADQARVLEINMAISELVEEAPSLDSEALDELVLDRDAMDDWETGTEAYEKLTEAELYKRLGIADEKMPFWNDYFDKSGFLNSWTDPYIDWKALAAKEGEKDIIEMKLRWHQLVGLVKLVDSMMAKENILIMVGVGVGKTYEAIALITMRICLFAQQESGSLPAHCKYRVPSCATGWLIAFETKNIKAATSWRKLLPSSSPRQACTRNGNKLSNVPSSPG